MATSTQISVWSTKEGDSNNLLPKYNGETMETPDYVSYLQNGHDYVWQVMLAQRDLSGTNNLYDIPVCRGAIPKRVGGDSDHPEYIFVDKDLPIYEWGYNGNNETSYPTVLDDVICAGMVVEVNGERRFIVSYQPRHSGSGEVLGYITLDSPFTTNPHKGDRYQIYSNYLISPQYFFMSRALPTLSMSLDYSRGNNDRILDEFSLKATGTYSQSNNTPIKYYSMTLYAFTGDVDSTSAVLYKLQETGKIFSQKMEYTFKDCLVGKQPWNFEDIINVNYRVVCELVTQDNVVISSYASMRIEGIDDYAPESRSYTWLPINGYGCNYCQVTLPPQSVKSLWYRTNLDTNETIMLRGTERRMDFKVSTKGNYQYTTIVYDKNMGRPYLRSIKHFETKTNFDGYFISALIPNGEKYTLTDTWKFICDIDDTTVNQNLDRAMHLGYSKYPTVSSTGVNYMSGTLSGMIGNFNCCEHEYKDDITLVNAWRDFISQPHPYLLKSQKGDVWVVNIVESPKVDYQEDYYKIPTRFTFSWAECADVDDLFIEYVNESLDDSIVYCSGDAPSEEDNYDKTTADDYIYTIKDGQVTIVMYKGDFMRPRIPDTIEGYPVTRISATAFYSRSSLQAAWLPEHIETVE